MKIEDKQTENEKLEEASLDTKINKEKNQKSKEKVLGKSFFYPDSKNFFIVNFHMNTIQAAIAAGYMIKYAYEGNWKELIVPATDFAAHGLQMVLARNVTKNIPNSQAFKMTTSVVNFIRLSQITARIASGQDMKELTLLNGFDGLTHVANLAGSLSTFFSTPKTKEV
jgi:hypothetical protein